jgi:hypothetical protein
MSHGILPMFAIPYASAIGSIMYAMICTHPDVSYALSATRRYQSNYDSKLQSGFLFCLNGGAVS